MKTITITLKKDELLYDIENTAYLVGESRTDGTNYEQVSKIQNAGEEEDRNFILRSMGNAYSEVKRHLSRYINEEKQAANNALIEEDGDFLLTLNVVDRFNEANTESLKSAAHEYILSSSLRDWFSTVKPDEITIYSARIQSAQVNLLSSLYRKKAPQRPTP